MINSPSHEEIARRAQEIWHDRGCPNGNDTAIWLEAERELADSHAAHDTDLAEPVEAAPVTRRSHGSDAPPPSPGEMAAKASIQKEAARAPQLQHGKNAPKLAPTESGKPLWDKPHSS